MKEAYTISLATDESNKGLESQAMPQYPDIFNGHVHAHFAVFEVPKDGGDGKAILLFPHHSEEKAFGAQEGAQTVNSDSRYEVLKLKEGQEYVNSSGETKVHGKTDGTHDDYREIWMEFG